MANSANNVMIVGASTRAAAFSALRSGFSPRCADLFADRDLAELCEVTRIRPESYPQAFVEFLQQGTAAPWIYTGALENWPTLVHKMGRVRPLWGNDRQALEKARSPWHVSWLLRQAGLPCPEVRSPSSAVPAKGKWVLKSVRSSAGSGVAWWRGRANRQQDTFIQEYIEGEPCSGLFVADGDGARLLGISRQLVGETFLGARPFHYCGTLAPLPIGSGLREACEKTGAAIARGCGLRGVFGIDGVIRDSIFWPLEVNPRYTASAEAFELALGVSVLAYHARVFDPSFAETSGLIASGQRVVGKGILFARRAVAFPDAGPWLDALRSDPRQFQIPSFADIPYPGAIIPAGWPIITLFVERTSVEECLRALKVRAAETERILYGPGLYLLNF